MTSAMLTFMLSAVHIREVVQFVVYLGCFVVSTVIFRMFRQPMRRAVLLLVAAVVIAGAYVAWHRTAVTLVGDIVSGQRAELLTMASTTPPLDLLFTDAPALLNNYVVGRARVFDGLTPWLLLAGPLVIVTFRRRPLVWLIASSTLVYVLVMSVPLLAIAYISATYYEILFTPVRNVIFFVYLFAGACAYLAVTALASRTSSVVTISVVAGAFAGALGLIASLCLNQSLRGFFAPVALAYALTFVWLRQPGTSGFAVRLRAAAIVVSAAAAAVLFLPERQPISRVARVNVRWSAGLADSARTELEKRFSLTDRQDTADSAVVNVWTYTLRDVSRPNVQAIVTHPDVVDTHHIDRVNYAAGVQAPPMDDPILGVSYVPGFQYPGWALFITAAFVAWLLALVLPHAAGWLTRSIEPSWPLDSCRGRPSSQLDPCTGRPSRSDRGLERPDPSTDRPEPSTSRPEPSTGRPEPSTGRSEPSTGRSEPSTSRPEPSIGRPEPSTGQLSTSRSDTRTSDSGRGRPSRSARHSGGLSFRHAVIALAAFVVPFGLWSARPSLSPLSLRPMPPFGLVASPRAMMKRLPCTTREQVPAPFTEYERGRGPIVLKSIMSCAPPYVLMEWMETNVPVDAVLAVNRWNYHLPTMFMPQQVVAYPGFEPSFVNEERLFEPYYRFYHQSMRKYGVQPFFNAVESSAERMQFARALDVTHLLVDPAYYNEMRGVLSLHPGVFDLKYADGRWAVYAVSAIP